MKRDDGEVTVALVEGNVDNPVAVASLLSGILLGTGQ